VRRPTGAVAVIVAAVFLFGLAFLVVTAMRGSESASSSSPESGREEEASFDQPRKFCRQRAKAEHWPRMKQVYDRAIDSSALRNSIELCVDELVMAPPKEYAGTGIAPVFSYYDGKTVMEWRRAVITRTVGPDGKTAVHTDITPEVVTDDVAERILEVNRSNQQGKG
jgi:hypothetical protein